MENKPTAVEWLIEQTIKPEWHSLQRGDIIEQAKQMEQEQLKNEYYRGLDEAINPPYYTEQ